MMHRRTRSTRRKRLIREVLAATPSGTMLLDELRWRVCAAEAELTGAELDRITRSRMVSFARTIREHCPELTIATVPIDAATPIGITLRAAAFRLRPDDFRAFAAGASPTVLCRYDAKMHAAEPRYRRRYVIPYFRAIGFRFFPTRPERAFSTVRAAPGVLIPATSRQALTVVRLKDRPEAPPQGCNPTWQLLGYESMKVWFPVAASDPLAVLM